MNSQIAETLRAARRLTEKLTTHQTPSTEEIARLDAMLRASLELIDSKAA